MKASTVTVVYQEWNLLADCWMQCITQSCANASIKGFCNTFYGSNMIFIWLYTCVFCILLNY